jgi:hypothetical protein
VVRRLASLFDGLAGATYRILGWGVNDQAGTRCIDVTRPPIIAPDLLVESVKQGSFRAGQNCNRHDNRLQQRQPDDGRRLCR